MRPLASFRLSREEVTPENREDRREEDDMWVTIMTNIMRILVASRLETVRAGPGTLGGGCGGNGVR